MRHEMLHLVWLLAPTQPHTGLQKCSSPLKGSTVTHQTSFPNSMAVPTREETLFLSMFCGPHGPLGLCTAGKMTLRIIEISPQTQTTLLRRSIVLYVRKRNWKAVTQSSILITLKNNSKLVFQIQPCSQEVPFSQANYKSDLKSDSFSLSLKVITFSWTSLFLLLLCIMLHLFYWICAPLSLV
jgi:hypothetical protein